MKKADAPLDHRIIENATELRTRYHDRMEPMISSMINETKEGGGAEKEPY
jgi:hypothetical protein